MTPSPTQGVTGDEVILSAEDAAYKERNQVVAALAKCFPSGISKTAIEGWDEAWHNCVYIDLPTGQASWHFHDRDAYLFSGLPQYAGSWDGHSTPEKYDRLYKLRTVTGDEVREAVDTLDTFISEVHHAQEEGPWWFTKGEAGLYQQVRMWRDKSRKAIPVLHAATQPCKCDGLKKALESCLDELWDDWQSHNNRETFESYFGWELEALAAHKAGKGE